jgi:hypothetical protein
MNRAKMSVDEELTWMTIPSDAANTLRVAIFRENVDWRTAGFVLSRKLA